MLKSFSQYMKKVRHILCITIFFGTFVLIYRELTVSFLRACGQTFRGGEPGVCQQGGEAGIGGEGALVKG